MEKSTGRQRLSRFLHWIGDGTSRASTASLVMVLVVGILIVLALGRFSSAWESAFSVGSSAILLVMVFVIQHTQSRQQVATQLKLDELIRAAPRADDLLIHVESADDSELIAMDQEGIDQHSAIRQTDDDEDMPEATPGTPPSQS